MNNLPVEIIDMISANLNLVDIYALCQYRKDTRCYDPDYWEYIFNLKYPQTVDEINAHLRHNDIFRRGDFYWALIEFIYEMREAINKNERENFTFYSDIDNKKCQRTNLIPSEFCYNLRYDDYPAITIYLLASGNYLVDYYVEGATSRLNLVDKLILTEEGLIRFITGIVICGYEDDEGTFKVEYSGDHDLTKLHQWVAELYLNAIILPD